MHSGYEVGFTAQSIAGPDYRVVANDLRAMSRAVALNLKVPGFRYNRRAFQQLQQQMPEGIICDPFMGSGSMGEGAGEMIAH
jgi:hypothetical protein